MRQVYNMMLQFVDGLGRQEWFYVLIGVVVIGAFCMRGFGSRSNY